ncbi:MAG TPA: toll/interleukin-1 receptor domain-containing protein [Urbifossiella sp.]|nr:toll/interleukin-1 receptor domain-containing protein [Urbifossiella sp.]
MPLLVPRPKVFITYASVDAWVAGKICEEINQTGVSTFLAKRNIEAGDDFESRIDCEAEECSEQVVVLSRTAIKSSYVWIEVGLFRGQRKRTVYLLNGLSAKKVSIAKKIPVRAKALHFLDLNDIGTYLAELRSRAGGT